MHIAIAGNIGSGKTTLAQMLERHFHAKAYFEEENNPYIGDFYDDMNRWSFNLQAYFLASRIEQTKQMLDYASQNEGLHIIQDRTIYEDAYIFARNLYDMGLLSTRDFKTYMKTFDLFSAFIPCPDLLIYLKASVGKLKQQIKKRGRDYEQGIEEDYLQRLEGNYEEWINSYSGNMLFINVDEMDFENDEQAFKYICDKIEMMQQK